MMTVVEVEHKKYNVRYDEETSEWICEDLNIRDAKLSEVKKRIDKFGHADRKLNVKALHFGKSWDDEAKVVPVTVTVLCDPEPVSRYLHQQRANETRDCWIKDAKGTRSKVRIDTLIPIDNSIDLKVWQKLDEAARTATKIADAALEKLPRHDADSLKAASKQKEKSDGNKKQSRKV